MKLEHWVLFFIGLILFCGILGFVSAWWEKRNEVKNNPDIHKSDNETEDSTNDRNGSFRD